MEMRIVLCLCACAAFHFVNGQVGSLCRPNEKLLSCGGCQRTCLEPAPECRGVCRTGCYCDGDLVRNATGHCVKLSDCPPLPATYKLDTTEPRPNDAKCPDNEEYRFCEPCNRTCDNPNPICPAQCSRGCFCVDDLVRDRDGRCVKIESCSNRSSNDIPRKPYSDKPNPYKMVCTSNQVYKDCEPCEKTCSNPNPHCPAQCSRGCFCKDGLYKAPNGDCLELEKCPRAEVSIGSVHEPTVEDCDVDEEYFSCGACEPTCSEPEPQCPPDVCTRGCQCRPPLIRHRSGQCVPPEQCGPRHELTIEDCDVDEEYFSCGACEPTCSEPEPQCPPGVCTRGCQCRPPLIRHRSGQCVPPEQCGPQKCLDPNEEYVCRYGCEASCDRRRCVRPRRCRLGCHCRRPFVRDHRKGTCVPMSQCSQTIVHTTTEIINTTNL